MIYINDFILYTFHGNRKCLQVSFAHCQWVMDVRLLRHQKEFQITSELTYENKTCSECQHDVRKSVTEADRQTDRLTERQKDRQKTERLFSFIIKTKVAKNVNGMSERQTERPTD